MQPNKTTLVKAMRLLLKVVLPLIVSVGLCWVLFRNDNISDIVNIVREQCDFGMITLMLLICFMSFVFRALRWQLQLNGVGIYPRRRDVLYSIFGTYAVNLVFPRLGEVWRTGYIADRTSSSFGTVMGTMIADRFADLITGILFTLSVFIVGSDSLVRFIQRYPAGYRALTGIISSPITWIVLTLLIIAIVWVLRTKTHNRFIARIQDFTRQLYTGFVSILSMPGRLKWLLWTILLWGCYLGSMYVAFMAFQFTRDIVATHGFTPVLICFTFGTISMGIPSNGGIGPYQIAIIFGLSLFLPELLTPEASKSFDLDSKAFANTVMTSSTCLTIAVGLWTFIAIMLRKKRSS